MAGRGVVNLIRLDRRIFLGEILIHGKIYFIHTMYFYAESVQQIADGGYILAGWTSSWGSGDYDMVLLKTDAKGGVQWRKTYGGKFWDACYCVIQTDDEGYALAGETYASFETPRDILKTDFRGNLEWQKSWGGKGWDDSRTVQQNEDGEFIIAGYSDSFGAGDFDGFIAIIDMEGNLRWQRSIGTDENDYVYSLCLNRDGDFIVAGYTEGDATGDDAWAVSVRGDESTIPSMSAFLFGNRFLKLLTNSDKGMPNTLHWRSVINSDQLSEGSGLSPLVP